VRLFEALAVLEVLDHQVVHPDNIKQLCLEGRAADGTGVSPGVTGRRRWTCHRRVSGAGAPVWPGPDRFDAWAAVPCSGSGHFPGRSKVSPITPQKAAFHAGLFALWQRLGVPGGNGRKRLWWLHNESLVRHDHCPLSVRPDMARISVRAKLQHLFLAGATHNASF
jgi:hypothetical protein